MEPEVRILKDQQKFKKKMIEKMKKQNKRYEAAFKLIESLIKENEKLKLESNSPKKTKKQTKKKPQASTKYRNNSFNSFVTNGEIVGLFKKYSTALQNVLEFRDILKSKNYKGKITEFSNSEEIPNKEILANAIVLIQEFINENLNPKIGIPLDNYYFELLDLFDGILDVVNLKPNLEKIKIITSKELKNEEIFITNDIKKLRNKIDDLESKLNLGKIDVRKQLFGNEGYSINKLQQMVRDVVIFSKKDNPIIF